MAEAEFNWEQLSGLLADLSKRWWGYVVVCQILVVAIGILVMVFGAWAQPGALFAAALTVGSTFAQWRCDRLRRLSDNIRRKFEMLDGLGWPISGKEASDLLVTVPKTFREKARATEQTPYYASRQPPSARRLLANLEESAWWTRHLTASMAQLTALICFVVFGLAAVMMIVTLISAPNRTTAEMIARVSTSVIVFMFSGGYFRLAFEYSCYSREAERIEILAHEMLARQEITDIEAVKLLHDYQVARAGAPSIPTWLWQMRRRDLNEVWNERIHVKD